MTSKTAFCLCAALLCAPVFAADPPKDPTRQTPWGLYLSAQETHAMKTGPDGARTLLLDVRDPTEIKFTGFAPMVDAVIPFQRNATNRWNEQRQTYAMAPNPQYADQVEKAFLDRGLDKERDGLVIMCRSGGERGAPAAKALDGRGFKKVYVMVDGFEGEVTREGPKKGFRLENGWKNAGLPWGYALDKSKFPMD